MELKMDSKIESPMMESPNEILFKLTEWNTTQSLGRLAQTCSLWNIIVNTDKDEYQWKKRVFQELTKQPKLKHRESFKDYYKNIYDDKNYSSYKNYLTKPIEEYVEEGENALIDNSTKYSLEAYLITACGTGVEVWAEKLIKLGANPNRIVGCRNPLQEATVNGHLHIIELLMSHGANINFFDEITNQTVFHAALDSPFPEGCLKKILNYENHKEVMVLPPLHIAVILNDLELIKKLFDEQIDLDELDSRELSPLGWAIILGRTKCVEILIEEGASLENVADASHERCAHGTFGSVSALRLAIGNKQELSLKLILKNGENPNVTWEDRDLEEDRIFTPIEFAVDQNFPEGLKLLLQYGAKRGFNEAFCKAASGGYLECLKILSNKNVDTNYTKCSKTEGHKNSSIHKDRPLTLAAKYGHTACVSFLLSIGANPNLTTSYQYSQFGKNVRNVENISALHEAVKHLVSVGVLSSSSGRLSDGSDYFENKNTKVKLEFGQENFDPLDINNVLSYQAILSLELLLKHGAKVNFVDSEKKSALSILISGIRKEKDIIDINRNKMIICALDVLFKYNVDPNIVIQIYDYALKKTESFSPLQYALKLENLSLIKTLVEKGNVNINAQDSEGNTQLQIASKKENSEIIEYLNEKLSGMTIHQKSRF